MAGADREAVHMVHADLPESAPPAGTWFIGTFAEEPGQASIVLRGDVDVVAVDRLEQHLTELVATRYRLVRIDATAVASYTPALLDLLGRTQSRIGAHRGLLTVQGLHPSLLPPGGPEPIERRLADTGPTTPVP